jgi:hypothetical protein
MLNQVGIRIAEVTPACDTADESVIHKERAAPSGTAPSTVPPRRSGSAEPDPRDGDPTHESRRVRHVTMRHWITSFTLLNDGLVCRGLPAQFKHLYARCAKGGNPGTRVQDAISMYVGIARRPSEVT